MSLQKLRDLIANDGYAITFQSMAAYRNALLAASLVPHPAAAKADERSTIACQVHSGPDCIECGGTGVWLMPAEAQPRVQRDTDKRIGLLFESKEAADRWKARAPASPAAAAATTSIATEALKALMRACDARELPFLRTPAEMLASIIKWELDEQPAQADTQATEQATIPEPTDDVLCACGWETWNSLGSYVDRGTATGRYRTIAAYVLEHAAVQTGGNNA
ncbi:hypothetical protein DF152_26070 [Burkholderia cenocepacia]|nr:hypothetical protein DF152_26070 [Burkholderia cenocepacia]